MKKIYLFIIFLVLLFFCLFNIKYNRNNNYYYIDLPHYAINSYSYITGVFYKTKTSQILLHGYSPLQNISFTSCYFIYENGREKCFPIFIKSYGIDLFYYNVEIQLSQSIKPLYLILNDIKIDIPYPVEKKYKYIVCSPVLVNFNRFTYLIEHIESMKAFGVSKVVAYYVSSTPQVRKILQYYVEEGILEVNKYNKTIEEVWKGRYYGEIWKLNHCFHKYQEVSNYIMELDFDEILWPTKVKNYDELFSILPSYDIYFLHARIFPPSNTIVEFKHDKDMKLNDVDMFKINMSCQTQNGYARKYVIANPLKVSCLEIHNVPCHTKVKETTIESKYAYDRHTRHLNPEILKICPTFIKNEMDYISTLIYKKSNQVKSSLF